MKKIFFIKNKKKIVNIEDYKKIIEYILPIINNSFSDWFFLLSGDIGSGKTTFAKILSKYIGIKENLNSPSFNIINRYKINDNTWLNHFDFFRLKKEDDLSFFDDLVDDNFNIIEWPKMNTNFWKKKEKKIFFNFSFSKKYRMITISNREKNEIS